MLNLVDYATRIKQAPKDEVSYVVESVINELASDLGMNIHDEHHETVEIIQDDLKHYHDDADYVQTLLPDLVDYIAKSK